jgi:hypothetical protein
MGLHPLARRRTKPSIREIDPRWLLHQLTGQSMKRNRDI